MDRKSLLLAGEAKQKLNPLFLFATGWIVLDLIMLLPVQRFLDGAIPFFTIVWLLPPLIFLLSSRDPGRIGIRRVGLKAFLVALGLNSLGVFLVMILLEPWSRTYQTLIKMALETAVPDTTFAWLLRFPGAPGMVLMFLYTGLVSMFAEELFFRGWLLQQFGQRMPALWAVLLQALLFSLPQAIAALFLDPPQALIYLIGYSFIAVGVIGGWADWRTKSIWPSLITVSVMNLIFIILTQ